MLLGFQRELGSLSTEIETLQKQSISMSVQLCNRQAVRGELSQFVDDMIVPELLIRYLPHPYERAEEDMTWEILSPIFIGTAKMCNV